MTYRVLPLFTALGLTLPAVAVAQMESFDANGDGLVTYEELLIIYPDMTEENFATLDINEDGALDPDEVSAGREADLFPMVEG